MTDSPCPHCLSQALWIYCSPWYERPRLLLFGDKRKGGFAICVPSCVHWRSSKSANEKFQAVTRPASKSGALFLGLIDGLSPPSPPIPADLNPFQTQKLMNMHCVPEHLASLVLFSFSNARPDLWVKKVVLWFNVWIYSLIKQQIPVAESLLIFFAGFYVGLLCTSIVYESWCWNHRK